MLLSGCEPQLITLIDFCRFALCSDCLCVDFFLLVVVVAIFQLTPLKTRIWLKSTKEEKTFIFFKATSSVVPNWFETDLVRGMGWTLCVCEAAAERRQCVS